MSSNIAFQGELGAYGHQACADARPNFSPLPCETFDDAIESVRKGDADLGMIAVENSTYGRVADVHSLLPESGLHIVDEVFVRVNGEQCYLWRAVDLRGEVLESFVTKRRGPKAALKFLHKAMKRYGRQEVVVTDLLWSFPAAMKISETPNVRGPIAGSTIGLKINISRSDDESARWRNSGARNRYRSSPLPTLQSATIPTRHVTLRAPRTSKLIDRPPLSHGIKLQLEPTVGRELLAR